MITQEDKNFIIKLYFEDKWTLSKIAKEFGLHHATVLYHVRHKDRVISGRNGKGGCKPWVVYNGKKSRLRDRRKRLPYGKRGLTGKTYEDYLDDAMRIVIVRDSKGNVIDKKKISKGEYIKAHGYALKRNRDVI